MSRAIIFFGPDSRLGPHFLTILFEMEKYGSANCNFL